MAPELSISHSSNFNILTDNHPTTWNMLVSAQLTNSIEIQAKHHDSKNEWNGVVSPSKRNNIKLISQKKSWNEINSKQNLNTLNYDKIQKKNLAVPSKNIINISEMSNATPVRTTRSMPALQAMTLTVTSINMTLE